MSLTELIAGVEDHEKTLTVFNSAPEAVEAVRNRFSQRNVAVTVGDADDGPSRYAVLHDGDDFVTAVALDALLDAEDAETGLREAPYRAVLDHLDETMFTSYSPARMLAASREIEDRAWRLARGELHAGFQTAGVLSTQLDTYRRLGQRDGLDVHAYATSEGEASLPETDAFEVHLADTEEVARSWFVAYDGDGVDTNKCALLAEERAPEEYYGFWTYDADTVDYVIDHLSHRYILAEDDGATA